MSERATALTNVVSAVLGVASVFGGTATSAQLAARLQFSASCVLVNNNNISSDESGATEFLSAPLSSALPLLEATTRALILTNVIGLACVAFVFLVQALTSVSEARKSVLIAVAGILIYFAEADLSDSVSSIADGSSTADVALGYASAAAFVLGAARVLYITNRLRVSHLQQQYTNSTRWIVRFILGSESADDYNIADAQNTLQNERYLGLYVSYKFHARSFFSVELALIVVEGVASGLQSKACSAASWFVIAAYVFYVIALIFIRPHKFLYMNVLMPTIATLTATELTLQGTIGSESSATTVIYYLTRCAALLLSGLTVLARVWTVLFVAGEKTSSADHVGARDDVGLLVESSTAGLDSLSSS